MENLSKYGDPTTTVLANGRTVAESIRPSVAGITGAIVRRADQFGVPFGQKPNEVAKQVIIDPDVKGGGFVVDMSKMTKNAVEVAADALPNTADMDDAARTTALFRVFQAADGSRVTQSQAAGHVLPPASAVTQAAVSPVAAMPQIMPAPPQIQQQSAQAVQPVQPLPQNSNATAVPSLFSHEPATQVAASPIVDLVPRLKASFQSRNSPCTQDGFFHQIIRQGPNLILVYDKRAIGYPRTWPQAVDEDVAVHLEGASVIYITQTTGIEFTVEHNDICVLLIKEEHPYKPAS